MKIIKVILMLTIVISMVGCKEEAVEEVKYEKVKYENVEDIVAMMGKKEHLDVIEINNIVYTLLEDDLVDDYYEIIYNDPLSEISGSYTIRWIVYYLTQIEEYCVNTNGSSSGSCVLESSGAHILLFQIHDYLPTPILVDLSSTEYHESGVKYGIIKIYELDESKIFLGMINNSYNLLAYEEGTPEYNISREWLINTARENGETFSIVNEDDWISRYKDDLNEKGGVDVLGEMKELSLNELAENYYTYERVLRKIDNYLKIID